MLISKSTLKSLKSLIYSVPKPPQLHQEEPIYNYTQISTNVNVTMKWKKDSFYDSIETIHKSQQLKPIISLKNYIAQEPQGCIPISAVSKRGLQFDIPMKKVAKFLRQYPSIFEEFIGPDYNLPWFRLTKEAIDLHKEEQVVYENRRGEFEERLKRFILLSEEKRLPLKIIQGMQWYLGLPDEFLKDPGSCFSFVKMGEGLRGLSVEGDEKVVSLLQRNAVKRRQDFRAPLGFPLYPSKGLRLKVKISNWLDEFQRIPYVSPYEDSSCLNRTSDVFEKRLVGVLHELLSLFVDHSAERKKILCLRTYLGLPHKFYKTFERHPHIFYLSLRNKTCTAILKEAYNDDSAMETHPIFNVREKYIRLMNKTVSILKKKAAKKPISPTW